MHRIPTPLHVICAGCLLISAAQGQDPFGDDGHHATIPTTGQATEIGRYQLERFSSTGVMMVDTATGRTWLKYTSGSAWKETGNPVTEHAEDVTAVAPADELEAPATMVEAERVEMVRMPVAEVELTIQQRGSKWLGDSRESVRVHVGDVTGGRVFVKLQAAGNRSLMPSSPMRSGDVRLFSIGADVYAVILRELNNSLLGEDYVTLSIRKATGDDRRRAEDGVHVSLPAELSEAAATPVKVEQRGDYRVEWFELDPGEYFLTRHGDPIIFVEIRDESIVLKRTFPFEIPADRDLKLHIGSHDYLQVVDFDKDAGSVRFRLDSKIEWHLHDTNF